MKPSASEARLRRFLQAWYARHPAPDGYVDSEIDAADTVAVIYDPAQGTVHLQAADLARVLEELYQHRLSYLTQVLEPE